MHKGSEKGEGEGSRARILEAIGQLRKRKARPDVERIAQFIARRHGVKADVVKVELERLVEDKVVVKVDCKGSTSYRTAKAPKRGVVASPDHSSSSDTRTIENPDQSVAPKSKSHRAAQLDTKKNAHSTTDPKCETETASAAVVPPTGGDGESTEGSSGDGEEGGETGSEESTQRIESWLIHKPASAATKMSVAKSIDAKSTAAEVPTLDAVAGTIAIGANSSVSEGVPVDGTVSRGKGVEEKGKEKGIVGGGATGEAGLTTAKAGAVGITSKRGRQLVGSKRKKTKKSHGPEFESGSLVKRPRHDPGVDEGRVAGGEEAEGGITCDFCQLGAEKNKLGNLEELLCCKDCEARAHPSCMEYTEGLARRAARSPWQCMDCKTCRVCDDSGNADAMLFCDACDKGYHMNCHTPPISVKPRGKWVCCQCTLELGGNGIDRFDELKLDAEIDLNKNHIAPSGGPPILPLLPQVSSKEGTAEGAVPASTLPTPTASPVQFHAVAPESVEGKGGMEGKGGTEGRGAENGGSKGFKLVTPTPMVVDPVVIRLPRLSTTLRGQVPDAADWSVAEVATYFSTMGFVQQAQVFCDQEIDGKALLLMTRADVLTGLSLKLGPALKLHAHIARLQASQRCG